MYKLKITGRAKKELSNISKIHNQVLAEIVEEIRDDPSIGKPLTRELTGRYSYKVGLYRIIYKINVKDKVVTILSAGHRATIYR